MRKVENFIRVILVWLVLLFTGGMVYAEGTKELQPVSAEPYYLLINRGGGLNVPFAAYTPNTLAYQTGTSSVDYRLNVNVCNLGERIKLGFRGNESNTFYQIKNQAGTVVFGPVAVPFLLNINSVTVLAAPANTFRIQTTSTHGFLMGDVVTVSGVGGTIGARVNGTFVITNVSATNRFDITASTAGAPFTYTANSGNAIYRNGNISTFAEAVAGPRSTVGATGYRDTIFTPTAGTGGAGDYYIEFNRGNRTTFANNQITVRWYDITVTDNAGTTRIPGRLWSKAWHMGDGGSNAFKGAFFVYADDGIVTKINNSSISPHYFSISCNATGVTNTGNPAVDRMSVSGPSVYPQYKLFVNDPDVTCYPTGTYGNVLAITITGCGSNRCINTTVDQAGTILVTLNLDGSPGYNPGTVDRQLTFNVPNFSGTDTTVCIPWDGLNGLGGTIAPGSMPAIVDFLNGITHLPLYDCEDNPNGYLVSLIRPAGAAPRIFWDDSNISGIGSAPDGTLNLTGCTAPSATVGCHRWSNRGSNTCPPCSETVNSWWYANIVTTSTNLDYNIALVDANTTQAGTGIANNSFKSCTSSNTVNLNGGITSSPAGIGGTWSTSGNGTFANANSLVTTYTPSATDKSGGSVILVLTSTAGTCPSVTDSLRLTFVTAATANAGTDMTVCRNNTTAIIAGSSKSPAATTVLWSGGAGTYVPTNTSLALTYNPTTAEAAAAFLDLTMTVTPTDVTCPPVSDQVRITFDPSPTASAGSDQSVCASNPIVTLAGSVGAGNTGSWTSLSGCATCFSDAASLTSTYTLSATDIINGSVRLVLSSSKAGCNNVTDTVLITVVPAQTVNAGPDQSRCKNNAVATLAGSVMNLGTGSIAWTSSSGCTTCFSSTTSATPTYTPSAGDLSTGNVTLTLTATKAGCTVVTDQMTITYTASPTINVGADQNVCSSNPCISFTAVTTVATGVNWDPAYGTGTFAANRNASTGTYCLSAAEVTAGIALLVAQTTGIGNCSVVKDSLLIFVRPSPTVDAGAPISVCANNPIATLAGSSPGAPAGTTFAWTSLSPAGQQGTFSSASTLAGSYTLSATEISNGTATLRLSATAPFCAVVTDNVVITVTPSPTVNAGADQGSLCYNPGTATLNGFSSTGTGVWSGGSGSYSSTTDLNAVYSSLAAERAAGVTLTLTSTTNGNCNAVSDQVFITFGPQHFSFPNASVDVCANNPVITLTGNTNTTGGQWSGGSGSYSPNANKLNTTYTPTAAEIAAGTVTFTLTTTGTGSCPPAMDDITVAISSSPTIVINGGNPITVCGGSPAATFTAVLSGATGVTWSGGAGTYSSTTGTTITYTPTATEIANGSVVITGTTTGNGSCNAVSSNITLNYSPVPTLNAGADQVLCGSSATASLLATFTNATGVTWTTTGTGSLSSTTTANPTYTPSAADKTGVVTFTATTTGTAPCAAISDQMNLSFTVVPTIDAGPDMSVCANAFPAQLNASGSPATWSGGAGTFSPSTSAMAGTYTPTAGEIGTNVTLTATTVAFGACPSVSDQMVITVLPAPLANAGPDATVCGNAANFPLNGSVTNATGLNWFTSATGTFSDQLSGTSTYAPSASDKTAGTVTLKLVTTGTGFCPADTDEVVITITPTVTVFAGPDQTLCKDGAAITMTGGAVTGATGGLWTVISGTGVLANATSVSGATYTPSAGDNSFTLRLTTTGNPAGCSALFDEVTITLSTPPTANAGADQSLCTTVASVALTGSVLNALSGVWTTNGSGTFSPNNTTLNTSYVPSATEASSAVPVNLTFTLTTVGNGVCSGTYIDQVDVVLAPRPTANANVNQTVCANNAVVTLTGTASNNAGTMWTTSGDGSFAAAASLNTTYTPGPTDITNGSVNLTLTATGLSTCAPASDVMVVTITPAPTITAGPDRSVCANNASLGLIANINTAATGGTWTTSGDGTFSGVSADGLTATYNPGVNDRTTGTVTLTATTTGNTNNTCTAVSDFLILTITPAPTVNAGADVTICADSFYVELDANFTVATAGIWSTSGTGNFFNSNATYDTAVYVPSPADRTNAGAAGGTVTLTFTTTVQGACLPVSDQMTITITPAPTVSAGADQLICSSTNSINISGTKNAVATGVIWTTSGNGTFGSNTALSTTYTPSAVDKAAGSIVLTLTSTGTGSCRTVMDQLFVNITPLPVVNAGVDETVCADRISGGFVLTPTVSNQTGITWTTGGTGTFGPNSTTLGATYFPSALDTTTRSVTLTITATGNTPCPTVADSKLVTFRPVPIVNAGADQTVCNGSNVSLSGSVTNASGGTWARSTGGTSGISNPNTLSTTFVPTPADTTAGSVKLVLTSSGMGTCTAVTDTITINFRQRPLISATADFSVCANAGNFQVTASTTNATGISWTSSGSGGFGSTTGSPVMYSLSAQDITNGTVTLTASTTGMAPCAAVTDNVVVTITPIPTVDAGPNINICSNADSVSLGGVVTNATGGFWATEGDGTFNNPSLLNAAYILGLADSTTSASIKLRLFSSGTGACPAVNDSVIITLTPTTNVNPMPDMTVCDTDLPIQLNGSGAAAQWSTVGGDGVFSNPFALTGTYTLGANDSSANVVTFRLKPTGTCGGPADTVVYTIIDGPLLDVVPVGDTCTNAVIVNIDANATAAGTWTTSGSGSFGTAAQSATTYTPSNADKTAGNVLLTYTIFANGFCNARQDTTTLIIHPTPTVSAGPDKSLCANLLPSIQLEGNHSLTGTLLWTKLDNTGVGTLTNTNQDVATYQAVDSDTLATPVRFELSIDNGVCSVQRDTMQVVFTPSPQLTVGNDTTVCADKVALALATYTVATGGIWTTSGTGTFTPNSTVDNPTYVPSQADTAAHVPVTLTFTTTGNGSCTAVSDSKLLNLTIKPIVIAGIDDSICSGQLFADVTGTVANAPGVLWTTTGTGTFGSATSAVTQYFPSAQDKANGGAILRLASTGVAECDSSFDYKTLIIVPSPAAAVNAGFDQVICRDDGIAPMAGFIYVATGAKWDCNGVPCTGNFSPNDEDLFAQYIPSAADTAAGSVVLRLITTTGNGICDPAYDDMLLTITDIPHPDAGTDKSVCADTTQIPLTGNISAEPLLMPVAYEWVSSGTGVFTPNAFVQNPVYLPSPADKASGSVVITLSSLNNGTCEKPSDPMFITITPQPTINAGIDRTTCANVNAITTIGTMTVATTAVWTSSGTGTFSGVSADGLTATYDPSPADDTAGTVSLTLTTNGGLGTCRVISDQYVLTIDPAPIVNAGPDQTICADNAAVPLNGSVLNATGGFWRTLGSGVFTPATDDMNASYDPSNADTTARVARLVLTSSGNGFCLAEDDTITYTISPIPVVDAGSASVCRITVGAALNATISNALGGVWSTSGSGTFALNNAITDATYYPSLADSTAGIVTLTLTSTGNGVCTAVSNTTNLIITPVPVVTASPDQFVCVGAPIILTAQPGANISRYEWTRYSGAIVGSTASISVLPTTDTSFIVTAFRADGCNSDADTVHVRTFAMPSSIALNGTNCLTDSNVINAIPNPAWPPAPGVYTWTRNGTIIGGQTGTTINPTSSGTYSLTFTAGACSVASGNFALNPSPIYSGIDKTNCVNNTTVLTASTPLASSGSTFTYTWDANPYIVSGLNGQSVTVQYGTVFDTTSFNVSVSNEFSCATEDSVYLITVAQPLTTLENDTACVNDLIILSAVPTNYGVGTIPPIEDFFPTYVWTRNGINLNVNNDTLLVTTDGEYIVNIIIGDCTNNTDTSTALFNTAPELSLPGTSTFCDVTDSSVTLSAGVTPELNKSYLYLWSSGETTPTIVTTVPGYHYVTITSILGSDSCQFVDSAFVKVVCSPRVYIPNVFVPGSEGPNGFFQIFGTHFANFKLQVFSRWGEVIFSATDRTEMWDGTYKGELMPAGVYPYVIVYEGETEENKGPYKIEGEILIMR